MSAIKALSADERQEVKMAANRIKTFAFIHFLSVQISSRSFREQYLFSFLFLLLCNCKVVGYFFWLSSHFIDAPIKPALFYFRFFVPQNCDTILKCTLYSLLHTIIKICQQEFRKCLDILKTHHHINVEMSTRGNNSKT